MGFIELVKPLEKKYQEQRQYENLSFTVDDLLIIQKKGYGSLFQENFENEFVTLDDVNKVVNDVDSRMSYFSEIGEPIINFYAESLDKYMSVINYNELDNYIVENPDTIIYVSVLEDEKIRGFEKKLKIKYKNKLVFDKLLR